MKALIRANLFLLALVGAVAAAWIFPEAGSKGSWLHPELIVKYGIALIFFNVGALLPVEKLREDLMEWRLHTLVQGGIFLLAPLLTLTVGSLFKTVANPSLFMGFLYLSILPTTITTAIVFTMAIRGNVAAAIFNTSLSNILALGLTPAWILWHMPEAQSAFVSMPSMFGRIVIQLFLPLLVGQIARLFGRAFFDGKRVPMSRINNAIIFFLVYASFSDSVKNGVWGSVGLQAIAYTSVLCLLLVGVTHGVLWVVSGRMHLRPGSRWCAVFCGGQKSLAVGAAMLPVLFGRLPDTSTGLVLVPVLIYHFFQLMIGAILLRLIAPVSKD